MDEYLKRNHKKFKDKKYYLIKPNHSSFKNKIIQFSLNSINTILINSINSSTSLGIINITNNLSNNNTNGLINNNSYLNSINDCIDYKLKGNIYKIPHNNFINLYPNIKKILSKKSRKELKIIKFDKEIFEYQTKTPTKKTSKNIYFNLMKNNNINIKIYSNDNNKEYYSGDEKFRRSKEKSEEISNQYKFKNINNNNYYIYRNSITINSNSLKDKYCKYINDVNPIKETNKKKISPNAEYFINKTNDNSKERQNINKNTKNINTSNKNYVYKFSENKPKKLIILKKTKDNKITNLLKNKTKNINRNLNLDLNNSSSKYNFIPYNIINNNRNTNIQKYKDEYHKTTGNISYNKNKKIIYINNNIINILNDLNKVIIGV